MLYLKKKKKQVTYLRLQNKVWMKSVYYAVEAELIMEHCGEELNIYIYENVHCSVAKTQVGLNHHVRALPYLTHNMSAARVTKKLQHHQFLLQHLPHGMTNQ